jgi:dephospho-CoA kinase
MVKIGLTGGIASGKSTIAKLFKKLGAEVIDADKIAHNAIAPGTPAYKKIVKILGSRHLNKKGEINRTALGKTVFSDPEKLKKLNAIVHPEVFKEEKREEKKIREKNPHAVIIFDIPLLFETGSYLKMDKVVLVYTRREAQVKRLMTRNHLTREESLKRIRAQMPFCQKKKLADYIVSGEDAGSRTEKKVKQIYQKIKNELSTSRDF